MTIDFIIHDINKTGGQERSTLEIIKNLLVKNEIRVLASTHADMPSTVSQVRVPVLFRRPLILKDFFFRVFASFLVSKSKNCLSHATGTCAFSACLATDADPMNKIIQGSGLCFKEEDPEDLSQKMQVMLENPSEVEAVGKNAREMVKLKYTNHVIAKELFKISEGLMHDYKY